jgi:hypothetical protein
MQKLEKDKLGRKKEEEKKRPFPKPMGTFDENVSLYTIILQNFILICLFLKTPDITFSVMQKTI